MENDVRKMGFVNWRQVMQDGDGWRTAAGEGLVLVDDIVVHRRRRMYFRLPVTEDSRRWHFW